MAALTVAPSPSPAKRYIFTGNYGGVESGLVSEVCRLAACT